MRSREGRYRDALLDIEELVRQLPGGVDEDADPADWSPKDISRHIGGLILQRVRQALRRKGE